KYSARQVLARLLPAGATPSIAGDIESEGLTSQPGGIASVVRRVFGDHNAITVKGQGDMLVYRAKCCNPIRGEGIVGYVTRGKGVAVHALSCANVQNLMYEVERKIDVEWARTASDSFPVKLLVHTEDRPGMLNQLTTALFTEQTNIRSLEARSDESRTTEGAVVDMTLEVRD